MKKISYLLLLFLSAIVCGCSEYEQPYVGYIVVERAVLDAAANSSATVTADTDISSAIVVDNVDADWCQVSVNGKDKNFCSMTGLVGQLPVMVLKPVTVVDMPACLMKTVQHSGTVRTAIQFLFLISWKLI